MSITPREFLERLQERLGGTIGLENAVEQLRGQEGGVAPHLYGTFDGLPGKIDFTLPEELLFEVFLPPPTVLLVRPRSWLDRVLGAVGLCPTIPTGQADLDDRFVVQNIPADQVGRLLTPAFVKLVLALGGFSQFEMTFRAYRLRKEIDITGDYTLDRAAADLRALQAVARFGEALSIGSANT
ncbi:MAG: hypothetical protein GX442_20820 [Candidatus Riflebacteria bacterium]|nr:hypothetical protein [Candidatus Riflebacteria bacterium]